jgi:glycosyltransferase involved in cell wall biosynthesis
VLFQARINLFSAPGGDTIQITKTMEYLRKLGIVCDLNTSILTNFTYKQYDIVHLFNFTRIQETYWFARSAKCAGKRVVLSTIYWDNTEVERLADLGLRSLINRYLSIGQIEYLKGLGRFIIQREANRATLNLLLRGFSSLQEDTLQYIDYYLPNAEIEMEMFRRKFEKGNILPYLVIPNGVDVSADASSCHKQRFEQFKDCILCVGRIDGRKNQLNLVRALKDVEVPVVFVGQPAPNHRSYMNKIKKEARRGMHFLGWVGHEYLVDLYKNAKVHVCPSWYETPGLASLEAGAAGCNIVVTNKGSTQEYFGSYAYYCEPDSVSSIRDAVLKAYYAPKDERLKDIILRNYTWEKAAKKTAIAYETVMRL